MQDRRRYFAHRRDRWLVRAREAKQTSRPAQVAMCVQAARLCHWQYLRVQRGEPASKIMHGGTLVAGTTAVRCINIIRSASPG